MIAAPVIGHRAAAGVAPENTLAAVRAAADLGLRWIEVDVQLSADGQPVIHHDATLERCTNGHGELAAHSCAELLALDAGSHFDGRFAGEPMPSLQAMQALCAQLGLGLNLELKVASGRDAAALAVTALQAMAAAPGVDVLVSSFDRDALQASRQHSATVQLGLLCETWPADLVGLHAELRLVSVHCDGRTLQPAQVEQAHALGLDVYAWTVNEVAQAQALWAMGADGIISDYPQPLLAAAPHS